MKELQSNNSLRYQNRGVRKQITIELCAGSYFIQHLWKTFQRCLMNAACYLRYSMSKMAFGKIYHHGNVRNGKDRKEVTIGQYLRLVNSKPRRSGQRSEGKRSRENRSNQVHMVPQIGHQNIKGRDTLLRVKRQLTQVSYIYWIYVAPVPYLSSSAICSQTFNK